LHGRYEGISISAFLFCTGLCRFFRKRGNQLRRLQERKTKRKMSPKGQLRNIVVYAVLAAAMIPTNVYAASEVTAPLTNLKTLIVSIIGAVGVIILAKNVMEFAQSYQQQDSSSMHSAIKGIVAGLIMAAISSVITFLGL